jgi:hypothetical protein
MSSVLRTFWTLGDTMDPSGFDGKEGVDGSSPSEGFIGSPHYGGVSCLQGSARIEARAVRDGATDPDEAARIGQRIREARLTVYGLWQILHAPNPSA